MAKTKITTYIAINTYSVQNLHSLEDKIWDFRNSWAKADNLKKQSLFPVLKGALEEESEKLCLGERFSLNRDRKKKYFLFKTS